MVPEGRQEVMMDTACDDGNTYVQLREGDTDSPPFVICPRGFKHRYFPSKLCPGVSDATCDIIGPRVSWQMLTLDHFFVQQYNFYQKIEEPTLRALGGTTSDLVKGVVDVLNINRYEARVNADGYAWFATELAWTMQCGRDFESPMAGDDDDPNSVPGIMHAMECEQQIRAGICRSHHSKLGVVRCFHVHLYNKANLIKCPCNLTSLVMVQTLRRTWNSHE